ncbi:IS5 family transposase [Candidatus Auribacterota bacterium]
MTIFHYDLNKIVENHPLNKINGIISFKKLALSFKELEKETGRSGYGVEVGIRSLFLQFYYDLSDRQTEERLRYDIAFRWFCNFSIDDITPDHTFLCRVRKAIGTKGMGSIFRKIKKKAKKEKILRSVFSFVDASAIKVKETTWEERDKAIKEGEEFLNNKNVGKYSADKEARFGCKGKDKFWFGYKRHVSVDMGSGLIEKVAITPANLPDQDGLQHVCPKEKMVFGDKAYCLDKAQKTMKKNGCHSGAIFKNNMKNKNKEKDRWIARVRAPFESVFSKKEKRARYQGIAKMQLQAFMEAIVFNAKRLVTLNSPPLFAGA